jgi:arsenate reductase
MVIYHYPKCTTCQKALNYLRDHGISFTEKHIVSESPSGEELKQFIQTSGLPIQKFFNTSGIKYRELGLSSKLKGMNDEEKIDLLASDGMLIKRPIATDGNRVTVGFKEDVYKEVWI